MKYFKKLIGEKIYLSPMNVEDAEKFVEWLNDFSVTDYVAGSSNVMTLQGELEWFQDISKKRANFAIITMEKEELIGTISIESIDFINRIGTLGIFIGTEEGRNKGYGTEAVNLILDYGFNYLNLQNIKLDVLDFNERAIACYKKCGFKEYGRRRKCKFINGKYYDDISMDILSEEFKGDFIKNKNR